MSCHTVDCFHPTVMPLMMLLVLCHVDTSANDIIWTKKSCCTLFQLSWTNKCSGAIDNATGTTCCWCWWWHMTEMSCKTLFWLSQPTEQNGVIDTGTDVTWCWWSHFVYHYDHLDWMNALVLLMTLLATLKPKANTRGVTWPKGHFVPHLDHIDLMNAVVLLMIPLASHDTNAGTSGMIKWIRSCCTSFQLSCPNECNGAFNDAGTIIWSCCI